MEFLQSGSLPAEKKDAVTIKKKSQRFFLQNGELFRRRFNDKPLRCLELGEAKDLVYQMHKDEHQGEAKLYKQLIDHGYY